MKEIKLTKGKFALVDNEDFGWLSEIFWYAQIGRNGNYYACNHSKGKLIPMHRLILQVPRGKQVDHINGNGLDNQRNNLRICTQSFNLANMRKRKGLSSRFKGVSAWKNVWKAEVTKDRNRFYLGCFSNEEEAARAYDKKATELFGEFAHTNNKADLL